MKLSIVIVNWNSKELLKNCLSSLREYHDLRDINVIVVDNASRDGSTEMIEASFPEVRVIHSGGNVGFGKANNMAIKTAPTPYILLLNPDTTVFPDTIKQMTGFMDSNPSVGGLGCRMVFPTGETQPIGLQWFPSPLTEFLGLVLVSDKTFHLLRNIIPYKDPDSSGYVSKLYGGCLLIRKAVFDQIGYFDEQFFMYGEDVDLCRRITDAGWKLYYLSSAKIIHLCGGATEQSLNDFPILMRCESIGKLMMKYHGVSGRFLYRMGTFGGSCFRLLTLLTLRILSLHSSSFNTLNYVKANHKYATMIKWSLFLRKPAVNQ